uniref:Uncharacterized protein n=1 Tax=Branchiostoma floridae TaxID=7739 RepID=C3Y841_BRAFL|eukprot:XP_002607500.1 hypothetical protein BRAFLDRAFT_69931 [Branchiostoma floridae]
MRALKDDPNMTMEEEIGMTVVAQGISKAAASPPGEEEHMKYAFSIPQDEAIEDLTSIATKVAAELVDDYDGFPIGIITRSRTTKGKYEELFKLYARRHHAFSTAKPCNMQHVGVDVHGEVKVMLVAKNYEDGHINGQGNKQDWAMEFPPRKYRESQTDGSCGQRPLPEEDHAEEQPILIVENIIKFWKDLIEDPKANKTLMDFLHLTVVYKNAENYVHNGVMSSPPVLRADATLVNRSILPLLRELRKPDGPPEEDQLARFEAETPLSAYNAEEISERIAGEAPEDLMEMAGMDPKPEASMRKLAYSHCAILAANNITAAQPIKQDKDSRDATQAAVGLVEDDPLISIIVIQFTCVAAHRRFFRVALRGGYPTIPRIVRLGSPRPLPLPNSMDGRKSFSIFHLHQLIRV